MSTHNDFEDSRAQDGAAPVEQQTPEDFLFDVSADEVEAAGNPYGEDNEFEDGWTPQGLGPCAFDGPEFVAPEPTHAAFQDEDEEPPDSRPTSSARPPMPSRGDSGSLTAAKPVNPPWAPPPAALAPAAQRPQIPGRNRPSYSQGRTVGAPPTRRQAKPEAGPMSVVVPLTALFAGIVAGAYVYVAIGSEVMAGVAVALGALAGGFCRVLLWK